MKIEQVYLGIGIGLIVVSSVFLAVYIAKNNKKKEDGK